MVIALGEDLGRFPFRYIALQCLVYVCLCVCAMEKKRNAWKREYNMEVQLRCETTSERKIFERDGVKLGV